MGAVEQSGFPCEDGEARLYHLMEAARPSDYLKRKNNIQALTDHLSLFNTDIRGCIRDIAHMDGGSEDAIPYLRSLVKTSDDIAHLLAKRVNQCDILDDDCLWPYIDNVLYDKALCQDRCDENYNVGINSYYGIPVYPKGELINTYTKNDTAYLRMKTLHELGVVREYYKNVLKGDTCLTTGGALECVVKDDRGARSGEVYINYDGRHVYVLLSHREAISGP